MNNLLWPGMLLLIVALFVPIDADVLYNETSISVFSDDLSVPEQVILASLQTTKNFFARREIEALSLIGLAIGTFVPTFAPVAGLIFVLRALLADETDWKQTFSKTITREIRREITLSNLRTLEEKLLTMEEKFVLLNATSNPDMLSRKNIASYIHTELDIILNVFGSIDSLYRKYPLLSTPPIIALALFIIVFDPIVKELIPMEAHSPQLACKMIEIIEDYRPRAVHDRLEKLSLFSTRVSKQTLRSFEWKLSGAIFNAMQKPYDQYGYNDTIPASMDCDNVITTVPDGITVLLKDDFGTDKYWGEESCINDYALFVRYRVEQLFPVELLERFCDSPPQRTGTFLMT